MEYFDQLQALLQTEREEDQNAYLKIFASATVAERRANGLTWFPVAIRGTEMSRGDYLTVEVERTTHHDVNHQLRFGAAAVLFSNHDPQNDKIEGVIAHQSGNKLKITLRSDELPDWSRNGKLGIDVLFDNNSYDEMKAALKDAARKVEKPEDSHLIKTLTGAKAPAFQEIQPSFASDFLNDSQQRAVNKILSASDLAIVHGPPGTGKTTTLIHSIRALSDRDGQQILVVAPSNTAVDLLSEKLADAGLNVLRVGNPARVSERLAALTLDHKMAGHDSMKIVKDLKKRAAEYKSMAHKYKRNFGRAEQEQRKALFNEAHKIMKEVANIEQYVIDDLLNRAQVITATLVGSNHHTVKGRTYKTVVIDEAGQALEPACWIPILKVGKVIFAGDHCQLSPTVKSSTAAKNGLSTTLLEKCIAMHPEAVVLLEEQYRMNTAIMRYSSVVFYENKLRAHPDVADRLLFTGDSALSYIDTAGCGFDEQNEGTSIVNTDEAIFLLKHLSQQLKELAQRFEQTALPSIAVISPYRQQVYLLRELLLNHPELQPYAANIEVNTIDSFQGQERDMVYISLTRSNHEGTIGFLSDIRRMNVAMTRARKKLVVVGDSATLSRFSFYAGFVSYAENLGAYQSAWEFMET